jgi:hypothetical protein
MIVVVSPLSLIWERERGVRSERERASHIRFMVEIERISASQTNYRNRPGDKKHRGIRNRH